MATKKKKTLIKKQDGGPWKSYKEVKNEEWQKHKPAKFVNVDSANKVPKVSSAIKKLDTKKKGGAANKNWIQDATASIKRRGTAGKCTPISKPGCTGKARTLALTFKKMAKNK